MKPFAVAAVALLAGIMIGWLMRGRVHEKQAIEQSVEHHWSKVREYREFVENPDNFQEGSAEAPDVAPHLAALVSMKELNRKEVIIPALPNEREYILSWMKFCNRPGIFHATGPGGYQKGQIPLMFTVWYADDAQGALDEFIGDLRAKAALRQNEGEQGGAEQSASAPESKPEGSEKPKPELEVRPQ